MPPLFQAFFMSNFDIEEYQIANEYAVREYSIKRYIYNSPISLLYPLIFEMLGAMGYSRRIRIHSEFPKDKLVEIMKPYLYLYYLNEYSIDDTRREFARDKLVSKLAKFVASNPKFGVKVYSPICPVNPFSNETPAMSEAFNNIHCQFNSHNETNSFFNLSHLHLPQYIFTNSMRVPSEADLLHNNPVSNETVVDYNVSHISEEDDDISTNSNLFDIQFPQQEDGEEDDDDQLDYNDERYA
jgi:hypothetical protein